VLVCGRRDIPLPEKSRTKKEKTHEKHKKKERKKAAPFSAVVKSVKKEWSQVDGHERSILSICKIPSNPLLLLDPRHRPLSFTSSSS
jgi:hypothetical protein